MAANLERLAKEWAQKGYPQIANRLNDDAQEARKLGAPESFSVASSVKTEAPMSIESPLLKSPVAEYKSQPHTPELITNFWQTFLDTSIKTQGLDIPVPAVSCDRTQVELEALKKEGRMWVPEARLTYPQLGLVFPKMGSYAVQKDSPIKDEFEQDVKGVDVEADLDAPNRSTTQKDLENLFKKQRRKGMRLSTYVLASQASKLLTGHYLDENTVSRLFGSRGGGDVVHASFGADGRLGVFWALYPLRRDPGIGGRSEGVKKA